MPPSPSPLLPTHRRLPPPVHSLSLQPPHLPPPSLSTYLTHSPTHSVSLQPVLSLTHSLSLSSARRTCLGRGPRAARGAGAVHPGADGVAAAGRRPARDREEQPPRHGHVERRDLPAPPPPAAPPPSHAARGRARCPRRPAIRAAVSGAEGAGSAPPGCSDWAGHG